MSAYSSTMRARRIDLAETEDLVTLWHVGGLRPCQGPALKVPPEFLETEDAALPEGCELPDGSRLKAGETPVCGTCGERLGSDLALHLALSRERYRT
jgi:hypothetical protein